MSKQIVDQVNIDQLVCRKQVRREFSEEELTGLAQSLKQHGMLQPLLVRRERGQMIVVDGERRLRAAKMAGLAVVPVIVEDRELNESDILQRQLVANCQRADLTAIERAWALQHLMESSGCTGSQVAVTLGFSSSTVSNLLSLISLPNSVLEKVTSGELPVSVAYELARETDADAQAQLAAEAAENGLTRDAVAARVKQKRRAVPPGAMGSRATAVLGSGRSVTVCGAGLTLDSLIEWLEELLGKARRVRPKGLSLNTFLKTLRDQARAEGVHT